MDEYMTQSALEDASLHVNENAPGLSGGALEKLVGEYRGVMKTLDRLSRGYPKDITEHFVYLPRIPVEQLADQAFMQNWLRERGESVPDASMHRGMDMKGTMAGMASPADMARLATLRGTEFDRLFLSLMITHHDGALKMVDALVKKEQRLRPRALPVHERREDGTEGRDRADEQAPGHARHRSLDPLSLGRDRCPSNPPRI